MWTLPKCLVVAVCIFWTVLTANAIYVKEENSLKAPFGDESGNMLHWDMMGSAQFGGPHVIRLTTDDPHKQGAIWNNYPVISHDWELQLQFHIHGKGVYLNGDGMAIWYVKDPLHLGPVFGSKDYFSGLAVFIDTHENQVTPHKHRHPYISAMVNNGSLRYEHDEDGTAAQIGGCHVPIRNPEWPTKIAVSYMANVLTVFIDAEREGQWKTCFTSVGVHLPSGYKFGVSASTGEHSDNHDVIGITTLLVEAVDQEWADSSNIIPKAEHIEVPAKRYKDVKEEQKQKVEEAKVETIIAEETEVKKEEVPSPPSSLLRKAIYICGTLVILFVAVSVFKKYSAQRKERMQKRLF